MDLTFSLTRESLVPLVNSPKSFHIWKSHQITGMESSWPPFLACELRYVFSSASHSQLWLWFGETWEDLWRNGGGLLHFQSDDFGNLFLIFYRYNMTFSENRHFMCFCFTAFHCISLRLLLMSPLSSSKIQHYRSSCQKDMVVNQIVTSGGFRWFDMVWRPSSTAPTWTCLDLFPSWFFSSPNSPWVIEASHFWPSAPTHPHFCWPLRILRIQKRFQRGSIEKATWFSESSLVKSGHPFGQLWKLCSIWKGPQPFLANRWKINEDIKCRKIW